MAKKVAPPVPSPLAPLPPRAELVRLVGWVFLPLRAYLAIVFLYAGVSKIADQSFLDDDSLTGIHANVVAVKSSSPIGALLGPVVDHSFAFGLLMSIAEIAVGVGLALGLFTRIAALGGMFLSLSLWLTVSWGANPWFTSADLVYLFALTPLLLAGSGGVYSADGWLAWVAAKHPGIGEDRTRRTLLGGAAAVGVLVLLGAASLARGSDNDGDSTADAADPTASPGSSAVTSASPAASSTPSSGSSAAATTSSAVGSPTPTGAALVATSAVTVGGAKEIKDPKTGNPAWVVQLTAGQFTAFSAVCPHQQCEVGFVSAKDGFSCPCHGSRFSAAGKLLEGPATKGLTAIPVTVADGTVHRA